MRGIIVLAIILVLSITFVSAGNQKITDRITLEEGQSIDFNGKRITLLNLDFERERVIICINGERRILSPRNTRTVNGAVLELKEVTLNKAEIRIWVNCPGCECDENCDNSACIDECSTDKDCDDGNDLTEDKCSGIPKKCYNNKVKDCTIDEHCDDLNDSTIDKCSTLGKCIYEINYEEEIEDNQITSASVIKETTKYAQTINPLLLSITFGVMIIALIIKKLKY